MSERTTVDCVLPAPPSLLLLLLLLRLFTPTRRNDSTQLLSILSTPQQPYPTLPSPSHSLSRASATSSLEPPSTPFASSTLAGRSAADSQLSSTVLASAKPRHSLFRSRRRCPVLSTVLHSSMLAFAESALLSSVLSHEMCTFLSLSLLNHTRTTRAGFLFRASPRDGLHAGSARRISPQKVLTRSLLL
jgi:hypothetical protein